MRAWHWRQRPRRRRYETTGMLSRAAIGVSHPMQAERGCEIERRNGTRAATTLTKLPNASAGGNTIAARATFTQPLSAVLARPS